MYGFCKFQKHCPKQHIEVICPNYKYCDNNGCVKRHRKKFKYYERNGNYRFENCAYSHEKEGNNLKIEVLSNQVAVLKLEIEEIIKTSNDKLETERKLNSDQFTKLINTIADLALKIKLIEDNGTVTEIHKEAMVDNMNEKVDEGKLNNNTKKVKEVSSTTVNKEDFKCDKCNFKSNKEITLSKHINTKHAQKGLEDATKHTACNSLEFECTLCKDRFNTRNDLDRHKAEHIEEIENIDIESLTNGHDMFECNLCSFESGHEDTVKEHLIQHVNSPKDESGY